MALLLAGFQYLPGLAKTYLDIDLTWQFSLGLSACVGGLVFIVLRLILAFALKHLFNPDSPLHPLVDGTPGGFLSIFPSLVAVFLFFTCVRAAGTVQELNYVDSLAQTGIERMAGKIPPPPDFEALLANSPRPLLLAAVEGIASAENLGAVVRSCAALALDDVGGVDALQVSLLLLPVWLVCLFQNLSKTNIPLFCVALLAGSLALALKNPRKLLGTFALVLGIAVFVASTATFALDTIQTISPKGMRTLEDAFLNPTESKTVDQRGVIWDTAINYLKDHPVVGLGPGKSLELLGIEHAHNALLQSFLDGGLPGFLGLCCVIIGVFLRVGELLRAEYFAAGKITDERMLPLLSSLGAATYVCANMMSDCFSTATMPAFIFFAVFAFSAAAEAPREAPVLRASARRRPGARRRPARRIPSDFDAD